MHALPVLTIESANELLDALADFLEKSEGTCSLVIDRGGTILSQHGDIPETTDINVLAALAAGGFAANRELALRVGESDFSALYQQGEKSHVLMTAVDEDVLLVTIFGKQTTVGLVRFYATAAAKNIAAILTEARKDQISEPVFTAADISGAPRNVFPR
jgi:predicted regulator of Ras-like GTPase activity (Roadblock/LC7/MglB family)